MDWPLTASLVLDHLAQAVRWCEPRVNTADPAGCLRTFELPSDPFTARSWLVDSIIGARAKALGDTDARHRLDRGTGLERDISFLAPKRGRILAFFPDINLYHQMEGEECGWYIDKSNNPPQDTWLGYVESADAREYAQGGCLLSWVPAAFVESVDWAIRVSPEKCIEWLDDTPLKIGKELRAMRP